MSGRRKSRRGGAHTPGARTSMGLSTGAPPAPFRPRKTRTGIEHTGNGAAKSEERPPTDAQLEAWRLLDPDRPTRGVDLAKRLGNGVQSRLYALKRKGLAERTDEGWLQRGTAS